MGGWDSWGRWFGTVSRRRGAWDLVDACRGTYIEEEGGNSIFPFPEKEKVRTAMRRKSKQVTTTQHNIHAKTI